MADELNLEEMEDEDAPKRRSRRPIVLGLILALAGGGGGFYATHSGLLDLSGGGKKAKKPAKGKKSAGLPDIAFVPIDPIVVSLAAGGAHNYLRFRAQLEVGKKYVDDVTAVLPRVVDVLNSYLRAVSVSDIEDPSALFRLRAQMLRRVQLVAGEDRVKDLLVMEFVLN